MCRAWRGRDARPRWKPSAYPPSDSESRSDALAGVQICRQENLSEKRRARFGQRSCPRLARSVGSSANHAKQIGRTSPAFHRTDFATHPARSRTDSPAFYRTNFACAPARQSDGLTFGIPSPAFPRTDFARIRKADADSTISQPRYGRNQPPLNHEPTTLRVESMNDSDSTIPHSRSFESTMSSCMALARPSTASAVASLPTPPATRRRLRSCWLWFHERFRRGETQNP